MADQEQLRILKEGAEQWNAWRRRNPYEKIRLSDARFDDPPPFSHLVGAYTRRLNGVELKLNGADLTRACLSGAYIPRSDLSLADLSYADLSYAQLSGTNLYHAFLDHADLSHAKFDDVNLTAANLTEVNLSRAKLERADLSYARLVGADLRNANLMGADLKHADLTGANLSGAYLVHARFINTNLTNASLDGCMVYGVSAWALKLDGANQQNLRITPYEEPAITVDDLEGAQLVYLMLNTKRCVMSSMQSQPRWC
jgi:hypothetical protein